MGDIGTPALEYEQCSFEGLTGVDRTHGNSNAY